MGVGYLVLLLQRCLLGRLLLVFWVYVELKICAYKARIFSCLVFNISLVLRSPPYCGHVNLLLLWLYFFKTCHLPEMDVFLFRHVLELFGYRKIIIGGLLFPVGRRKVVGFST